MSELERIVTLTPAWDRRDPDPAKNYGIGTVSLRMVLKGPEGAVQFVVQTGWSLPHITDEFVRATLAQAELYAARQEKGNGGPQWAEHLEGAERLLGMKSRHRPLDALDLKIRFLPMASDVGYHSPRPMYLNQKPTERECEYVNGPCYYDGSSLRAQEWMGTLLREGSDGIWKLLEEDYAERFAAPARRSPGETAE